MAASGGDAPALLYSRSPALEFEARCALPVTCGATLTALQVVAQWGRARCSRMKLPHYTALTPMFMPVGTQGACCVHAPAS